MSDCLGCDNPGNFDHASYCPENRIEALKARLAQAEKLLRQCQPYVTLAVDNEYDGDKELVRGVAAFLGLTDSAEGGQK